MKMSEISEEERHMILKYRRTKWTGANQEELYRRFFHPLINSIDYLRTIAANDGNGENIYIIYVCV